LRKKRSNFSPYEINRLGGREDWNSMFGIEGVSHGKIKHNRSLMVAVQGPDFWPFPYTYISWKELSRKC
jgi:hypothetical protein